MPAYESAWFTPPAPVARVELHTLDGGATLSGVPMLMDTGADVTLIPKNAAEQLGLIKDAPRLFELVGFDGSVSHSQVVDLDLRFARRSFRGQFLIIDQEWGILGRNVLNAVSLVLNGPGLTWNEAARS